ncbi:MAG: TlpA family protein disulfide reductase [Gammaproteobacteria bacterium]|nr:TlpA family protein disulfide reductase [Gammaproteobacteria bacterium]
MKNTLIFIVAIIVAGGSGFALHKYINKQQMQNNPAIGSHRPEFSAMDSTGQLRNIKEWDGKLIFVNFWATWCPPCLKEIPDFIELQKDYGNQDFQIIGIALDNEAAVLKYANETGLNYPTMVVEDEGIALAKRYGNEMGALPYTAVINRNGEISDTITGELSKKRAKELLKKHGINL